MHCCTAAANYHGSAVVNNLSASGTAANNIFIIEWNPSTLIFTFRSMNSGLSGVVSGLLIDESADKIFFIGDFGSGFVNYQDFRVWDIGNAAWDTYTTTLAGYDGYWPKSIIYDVGDELKIELAQPVDAYGGLDDDTNGWQTIPWTTTYVYWDVSDQEWVNWQ